MSAGTAENSVHQIPLKVLIAETWRYLKPYKTGVFGALALLLVAVPMSHVHPLVWKYVVDDVLATQNVAGLWIALGIMLVAHVLAVSTGALQGWLLEKSGQSFVRDMRDAVFAHLIRQPMAYHHERRTGDLVTRVVSDIDAMESSVLRELTNLLEEIFSFVVVVTIVIALQPVVGLTTLIPLALSFLLIRTFGRKVKSIYEQVRRRLGDVGAFVSDRLGGVQLVQSLAREPDETARLAAITQGHFQQSIRALKMRTLFFPLMSFGGFLSNVVMLGLGTYFIWRGEFTIGGLIAYRGYWWRLQSPIGTLARMSDTLMRARAAAQRVVQVLLEPSEITSPRNPKQLPASRAGGVEFKTAGFAYIPGSPVLRNVSFRIEPGEFVAIAGRSGSGKSTLLQLIPRFYDVQDGTVLVDGTDVRDWQLSALRRRMAMVLQDTYLFNSTIRENLLYARTDATEAEVQEAAVAANAHAFIEELPEGYETLVGERGVKLSGGQKQRLSLARAFLASPSILLLDEPTSAVEPGSEEAIHQAIVRLSTERTTLLVTHRVGLLKRAGRILFLHNGQLEADSDHATLLESNAHYAAAYEEWTLEEELTGARRT